MNGFLKIYVDNEIIESNIIKYDSELCILNFQNGSNI